MDAPPFYFVSKWVRHAFAFFSLLDGDAERGALFSFKQFKKRIFFTMTNDELQSKTIAFLRFPLIVGVVLIHCYYKELPIGGVKVPVMDEYPIYKLIADLFSQVAGTYCRTPFFLDIRLSVFYKSSFSCLCMALNCESGHKPCCCLIYFGMEHLVGLHLLIELLFHLCFPVRLNLCWITDGVIGGISFGRENLVSGRNADADQLSVVVYP